MRHITIPIAILLLVACGGGKRMMKTATRFEQERTWQQAFDAFAEVHRERPALTDAFTGMRRTAQAMYDRLQATASATYLADGYEKGEKARAAVEEFREQMKSQAIDLDRDPLLEQRRQEARAALVLRTYTDADSAFRARRFSDAHLLTEHLLALEPGHQQAIYLQRIIKLEPFYLQGIRAADAGRWKEAHGLFSKVAREDNDYKELRQRMEEARQHAAFTLAYVPIYNEHVEINVFNVQIERGGAEVELAGAIKQAILALNDPLIMLVDRENTDELLAEQERGLNGTVDDRYAAQAGKLMGAKYVLTVRLLRFDEVLGRRIEMQVQFVDAGTGRIQMAEAVRAGKEDLTRGASGAQLMEEAARRVAKRVGEFDPFQP